MLIALCTVEEAHLQVVQEVESQNMLQAIAEQKVQEYHLLQQVQVVMQAASATAVSVERVQDIVPEHNMKRIEFLPRKDWQQTVESQGLTFHSRTGQYWNEEAAYVFTAKEIDTLERAANDVHELCLQAAQHVIDKNLFSELAIAPEAAELVKKSWNNDELHLYGRFDFSYDGVHPPKMLEYNADTPTSLLEASVIQWHWLQTCFPEKDQFNSLHESLIARWKQLDIKTPVHFTTLSSAEEDVMTTEYLRDTAHQAGLETTYLHLEEVGYNAGTKRFVNGRNNNRGIDALFKLYPWEWMIHEEYGQHLSTTPMRWIEPPWKMLWSNKGILPILW